MQATIFISYSRRNKEFVRDLFDALVEQGYDPWVDFEDIPFSVDWWEEIKDAIDRFDVFLFVVSNDSLVSRVANKELTYARELNKRIIPVIAEKVDIKEVVGELYGEPYEMDARDNYKYIRTLNWIYFYRPEDDFETGIQNIISATQVDRSHLREHTRILNRAQEWLDNNRGDGFLLQEEDLAEAERWLVRAEGHTPMPTSLQSEYIKASRRVEDERKARYESMKRQTRLLRRASAGFLITGIVVIGGVLFLLWRSQQQLAQNEERVAEIRAQSTAVIREQRTVQAGIVAQSTESAAAQQTVIADTTLQRQRADSLRLALESENALRNGDPNLLAIPLALQAHRVVRMGDAPPRAGRVLADVAYRPGLVRFFSRAESIEAHDSGISRVVYSPTGWVASAGLDRVVRVWDAATGTLQHTLDGHAGRVTALAMSADGSELVSGDSDGRILRWDPTTGELLDGIDAHDGRVTALTYSPDGALLVSGGSDTNAMLWDLESGEQLFMLTEHGSSITALAYAPDGRRFVSGDSGGRLIAWNPTDGFFTRDERRHGGEVITDITFADNGAVLTTSQDGRFIHWADFEGGQRTVFNNLRGTRVSSAVFLEADRALIGTGRGDLLVYDLTAEPNENGVLRRLTSPGQAAAVVDLMAGTSTRAAVAYDNSRLTLWDMEHGALVDQLRERQFPVTGAAATDNGDVLVRYVDGVLLQWQMDGRTTQIDTDALNLTNISLMPDGVHALGTTTEGDVVKVAVLDGERVQTYTAAVDTGGTVFAPGGAVALSRAAPTDDGGLATTRVIWDTEADTVLTTLEDLTLTLANAPSAADFNADATRLAMVNNNTEIVIFDVETGEIVDRAEREREISALAYAPGGALFIGYANGGVSVFQSEDRDWRDLRGHDASVRQIVMSPDGDLALTTAADGQVLLWDIAAAETVREYRTGTVSVDGAVFTPDGEQVVTHASGGTLARWRVDADADLIEWTEENRFVQTLTEADCRSFQIPEPCGE